MTKKGFLTAPEYRALRQTLGFTLEEAKRFHKVQNISTIKRWENGYSRVSELASNKIVALAQVIDNQVISAIDMITEKLKKNRELEIVLVTYSERTRGMIFNLGDLPVSVHTAMIQRVYAGVKAAGYDVGLVSFDPQSYLSFLAANGLKDSPDSRAAWAASAY